MTLKAQCLVRCNRSTKV